MASKKKKEPSLDSSPAKTDLEREEVLHLKASLLSNLSHELKTPLHTILSVVDVLTRGTDGALNGEQKKAVGVIGTHANSLLHSLESLLDFSRLHSASAAPHPALFDLKGVADVIAGNYAERAKQKGLVFTASLDKLPRSFFHDSELIRVVLDQLLHNAVKFTEKGKSICLTAHVGEALSIEVSDEGVGIEARDMPIVTKGFVQGEYKDNRRFEGLGVGLGVVRRAVELLGGDLKIQSEKNLGTKVHVLLPLRKENSRRKLLIIDDDSMIREHLASLLTERGYDVALATNAKEGLKMLSENRPQCVLLDIRMPEVDGFTLLKSIKQSAWGKAIPVIVISALDSADQRSQAFEIGADDFMVKPFGLQEVSARIERCLSRQQEQR